MIWGTPHLRNLHLDNVWSFWESPQARFLPAPPDAHGLQVHLGRSQGVERWAEDSHLQALVSASLCYKL